MSESTLTIRTNQPAFRVKRGREMSINKKVLHALGDPQYIHFWLSENNRILLIGDASEESLFTFKVNECCYSTKAGFKIQNSKFLNKIMTITSWNDDAIYTVTGKYNDYLSMVVFNFDDAVKLEMEPEDEMDAD